jgi:hypothetical protein
MRARRATNRQFVGAALHVAREDPLRRVQRSRWANVEQRTPLPVASSQGERRD